MRKEPSHKSEMVSQLLFGEYATIVEEKDDFVLLRCHYDGYEGWVQGNQLTAIDANEISETTHFTNGFSSLVTRGASTIHVPFGTPVYNPHQLTFVIQEKQCQYLMQPQQMWCVTDLSFSEKTLQAVYQPFLNTPYLWGGKSVFGVDCSGFAQQVFKFFGKKLLRDAYLQAEQGDLIPSVEEAKPGDLAFFKNEKGRITHVGIVLSGNKIVHASGKVRIDTLDADGIVNDETGKRTHTMHSIRRYF